MHRLAVAAKKKKRAAEANIVQDVSKQVVNAHLTRRFCMCSLAVASTTHGAASLNWKSGVMSLLWYPYNEALPRAC